MLNKPLYNAFKGHGVCWRGSFRTQRVAYYGKKELVNMNSDLEVNGRLYKVKINRTPSQLEPCYHLHKDGVHINLPLSMSREEMFKIELEFRKQAREEIIRLQENHPPKIQKEYVNGQTISSWGKDYQVLIEFKDKHSSSWRLFGSNTILLSLSSFISKEEQNKAASWLITNALADLHLPELKKIVNDLNEKHFAHQTGKISFSSKIKGALMAYSNGDIVVSSKLLAAQKETTEFLCLEALISFCKEKSRHAELLDKIMPDYKEKKDWLDKNFYLLGF